jgi:hypothetical protein
MHVILGEKENEEKQEEQITSLTNPASIISSSHSSSSSSSSTVILRDHAETIRTRRQCHSSISLLQHQQRHQQSLSSSFEEPFYDCKQQTSPKKLNQNFDMSLVKISACTMTGKSLNNLDECISTTSSEEKGVQTTSTEPLNYNSCVKRAISSTSLSSSSAASIQTDSLEKKSKILTSTTTTTTNDVDTSTDFIIQHQTESQYKWPHVHEKLLGEQTCIYWVNYLGKLTSLE